MTDQPPDISTLAAAVAGRLPAEEAEALIRRCESTPEGRELLAEIRRIAAFLRDEPGVEPPASSIEKARRLLQSARPGRLEQLRERARAFIATLDFDSRFAPAPVGFRGVSDVVQVAFSAEPCQLDLEIHPHEQAGRSRVIGQIDADETDGWRVSFADGSAQATRDAEPDGSFSVDLPDGSFTIALERDGVVVEAGPLVIP